MSTTLERPSTTCDSIAPASRELDLREILAERDLEREQREVERQREREREREREPERAPEPTTPTAAPATTDTADMPRLRLIQKAMAELRMHPLMLDPAQALAYVRTYVRGAGLPDLTPIETNAVIQHARFLSEVQYRSWTRCDCTGSRSAFMSGRH